MVNQTKLTISNFGYYAFHPLSDDLSPLDKTIALIGTLLLGLSCGIGHLICGLFFYNQRKIENITNINSNTIPEPVLLPSPPLINPHDTNLVLFKAEFIDITIRRILPYLDPTSRAKLFEAEFNGEIQSSKRVGLAFINCVNEDLLRSSLKELKTSLKICGKEISSLRIPNSPLRASEFPISNESLKLICSCAPQLTSLRIENCSQLSNACMEDIANLTKLSSLSLCFSRKKGITSKGLSSLSRLTNLTTLRIEDFRYFTSSGWSKIAATISKLPNLTVLSINSEGILNNESIKSLSQLKLSALSIEKCNQVSTESLQMLQEMKHLKTLDIAYVFNSEEKHSLALKIVSNFSQLTSLNISGLYTNAAILEECLPKLTNLTSLSIAGCRLTESVIAAIAKNLKLVYLDISHTYYPQWESIKGSIGNLTTLEKLIFNFSSLHDIAPLANLVNLQYLEIKEGKNFNNKLNLLPQGVVVNSTYP